MPDINQNTNINWSILFIAWVIVFISLLGSLFFSEVMEFEPCLLCWWQRIFMYPLFIVFLVGLISFEKSVLKYSIPLTIAGWLAAFYHNLVYYSIIPESIQPCKKGVSCKEVYIELLGFLSIPLLSLIAFTIILILLIALKRRFV